jgi:hypothetical protein
MEVWSADGKTKVEIPNSEIHKNPDMFIGCEKYKDTSSFAFNPNLEDFKEMVNA